MESSENSNCNDFRNVLAYNFENTNNLTIIENDCVEIENNLPTVQDINAQSSSHDDEKLKIFLRTISVVEVYDYLKGKYYVFILKICCALVIDIKIKCVISIMWGLQFLISSCIFYCINFISAAQVSFRSLQYLKVKTLKKRFHRWDYASSFAKNFLFGKRKR